jgi:hypothetical protein
MITSLEFWTYVGKWSLVGAAGFTILLILAKVTKAFQLVRDEEGLFRKPMPLGGWMALAGFVLAIFLFFIAAAYFGLHQKGISPSFWTLWLMNFLIFFTLLLFDTFIIDILILVLWHPAFLKLPDMDVHTSILFHLKTMLFGTIFSIVVSFVVSLAAWLRFF